MMLDGQPCDNRAIGGIPDITKKDKEGENSKLDSYIALVWFSTAQ